MKKVLIISICFSVGFVVVMLFLSHREMRAIERFKVKPVTDEIADLSEQRQRSDLNQDLLRSEVRRSQENSDVFTPDEFEGSMPDIVQSVATPKEVGKKALKEIFEEENDDEFEAFWKDIEGFVEKYLTDLRVRVDESVAQIEPLFEHAAFYKAQLEPLDRQGKLSEWSIAWKEFRLAERKLVILYAFLSEGPAREHFGDLYLSTPEYAKLKAFSEDWEAQRTHRTIDR